MFCALCLQGGGVFINSGIVTISWSTISGNTADYVRAHAPEFPMAPMGRLLTRLLCFSLAQLRTLRSTTAGECCRDLPKFPSPSWEITCFAFCACRVVVSLSMVAQWPSHHAPSVGTLLASRCTLMFVSSHCPHGRLTFRSLLAGWWCRSLWRHSDHLIVHHQWEHS
jgi:hypothetical protein